MKRPTRQQIKDSKNPAVEELAQDLDTFSSLDALAVSEGGRVLIDNLTKDIANTIDLLVSAAPTSPWQEVISHCADLKSKLDLLRSLTRAKKNKDFTAQALADALQE